jgi:ribosome-binding protein aMBF1 (putative translation factor)
MENNFYLFLLLFFTLSFSSCQNAKLVIKTKEYSDQSTMGEVIRKQRMIKGMTQEELARAVDISQNSLSLIEDGYATPIFHKMKVIESILEIQLYDYK